MSYTITPLEVQSPFGLTIRNHFFQQQTASDKLMILLPGRGYTLDHPALYHMLYLGLEQGYDVLPVQYGFQVNQSDLLPEQMPYLMQDITGALDLVMKRDYREVSVIGKSLGTPLAVTVAHALDADEKALILLTPIGSAVQDAKGIRTLAIVGTADPYYSEALNLQGTTADYVRWQIIPDLNHGFLKKDDWRYSVKCLYDILESCAAFLQESSPR